MFKLLLFFFLVSVSTLINPRLAIMPYMCLGKTRISQCLNFYERGPVCFGSFPSSIDSGHNLGQNWLTIYFRSDHYFYQTTRVVLMCQCWYDWFAQCCNRLSAILIGGDGITSSPIFSLPVLYSVKKYIFFVVVVLFCFFIFLFLSLFNMLITPIMFCA